MRGFTSAGISRATISRNTAPDHRGSPKDCSLKWAEPEIECFLRSGHTEQAEPCRVEDQHGVVRRSSAGCAKKVMPAATTGTRR